MSKYKWRTAVNWVWDGFYFKDVRVGLKNSAKRKSINFEMNEFPNELCRMNFLSRWTGWMNEIPSSSQAHDEINRFQTPKTHDKGKFTFYHIFHRTLCKLCKCEYLFKFLDKHWFKIYLNKHSNAPRWNNRQG